MMAAYSLYDLLRTLIERVGWPTEEERRTAVESVNEAERLAVLGNVAQSMACDHPTIRVDGRCDDCGRAVESGSTVPVRHAIRRTIYREG